MDGLRSDVTQKLAQIRPMTEEEQKSMVAQMQERQRQAQTAAGVAAASTASAAKAKPGFVEDDPTTWGNPGRNDDCPCGSGKKFKHCHGKLT